MSRSGFAAWLSICVAGCVDAPPRTAGDAPGAASHAGFELHSVALSDSQPVPPEFACLDLDHLGKSPDLSWTRPPPTSAALAVTMVDVTADGFVHWAVLNLPVGAHGLEAGASHRALPSGAFELVNDFGKPGYGGPCPPPGAPHFYAVSVYALREPISGLGAADRAPARLDARLRNELSLAHATLTVSFER